VHVFRIVLLAVAGFAAMIPLVQLFDWGGVLAGALVAASVEFFWSTRIGLSARGSVMTATSVFALSVLVAATTVVYFVSQLDFSGID
jgi:hypothetical protein